MVPIHVRWTQFAPLASTITMGKFRSIISAMAGCLRDYGRLYPTFHHISQAPAHPPEKLTNTPPGSPEMQKKQ